MNGRSDLECGGKRSATPLSRGVAAEPKRRRRCALPAHSKTWRSIVASLVFLAAAIIASAQQYSIGWSKIAGGGGTSTNAQYSVSGTIGQPDAGSMSGGNYTLTGGFWGVIAAVQTPGAPVLGIQLTTTNTVLVYWPSPSIGFNLQANPSVAPANNGNWAAPPQSVTDNGTIKYIIVNPPVGENFYRLKSP
jgi:hypothetical protein